MDNPYEVLGVSENASQEEIKRAYRIKAKECHPDLHPDDPHAQDKMNEVNEAYDILSDPVKFNVWKGQKEQEAYAKAYSQQNPYSQSYGTNSYSQGNPFTNFYNQQNPYGQQSQPRQNVHFSFFTPFGFYSSNKGFQSYFSGDGSRENPYGHQRPRRRTGIFGFLAKILITIMVVRFFSWLIYFVMGGGFLYYLMR